MTRPLTIEDMKSVAEQRGGACLSLEYKGGTHKLKWRCAKGHVWETTPSLVRNSGSWCPVCAGKKKLTLEQMHELAAARGGECLSEEYESSRVKLRWRCSKGHVWLATPKMVKHQRTWCPRCADTSLTIGQIRQLAKARGGECLSERCKGAAKKLEFRCGKGHTWSATPASVKNLGTWCPTCGGSQRLTIADMQAVAAANGGRCLSTNYRNAREKLHWQCAAGHTWYATGRDVRNNKTWCPDCAGKANLTLQQMQELASSRGGKCLSESFSRGTAKLTWQCSQGHVWTATGASIKYADSWCPHCAKLTRLSIEEFQLIAEMEGGKCLSTEYVNQSSPLEFECAEGHRWSARGYNIKSGKWCPDCGGSKPPSIDEVCMFAEAQGGRCHSTSYQNEKQPLEWSCEQGHYWTATFSAMKQRQGFCRICRG